MNHVIRKNATDRESEEAPYMANIAMGSSIAAPMRLLGRPEAARFNASHPLL